MLDESRGWSIHQGDFVGQGVFNKVRRTRNQETQSERKRTAHQNTQIIGNTLHSTIHHSSYTQRNRTNHIFIQNIVSFLEAKMELLATATTKGESTKATATTTKVLGEDVLEATTTASTSKGIETTTLAATWETLVLFQRILPIINHLAFFCNTREY